jgi:NAD-dependent dihydropyrimidine dehydrogenase PreA subunit
MVKFLLLGVIGIAAIFGRQAAWMLDPTVITARFVSLNLIPAATAAMNSAFIFLLRDLHLEGVRDLYRVLKPTLLGVKTHYFPHTFLILAYFLAVVIAGLFISRLWCRAICPLGALYAAAARFAPFHRVVDECSKCFRCKADCRTQAINADLGYEQGECIMCMDCVYTCPTHGTSFRFTAAHSERYGYFPGPAHRTKNI